MEARDPRLYAYALERGQVTPLPPDVAADMRDIAVGQELGVPATSVRALPLHWVGTALARIEATAMLNQPKAKPTGKRG